MIKAQRCDNVLTTFCQWQLEEYVMSVHGGGWDGVGVQVNVQIRNDKNWLV